MTAFPDFMDRDEAQVINRLITACTSRGYSIRVRNVEEGEVMQDYTTNRADIQRQTAATGGTLYDIREGDGPRIGSFVLIHGNGSDVASDYSWPRGADENEAIMDEIYNEANRD